MQEKLKYLFFLPALLLCLEAASQKKKHKKGMLPTRSVIAEYEGGQRNIITLTLFSDSTFYYQEVGQVGSRSTKMGAYLWNDTTIALYTWRSYDFLKNLKEKVRSSVYRCDKERVLMYTHEQESSPDSTFYRSYFTLSRKE
ncbi:MAG: hypothetical protein ABIR18_14615 [Chitinophagaceae bacterium]